MCSPHPCLFLSLPLLLHPPLRLLTLQSRLSHLLIQKRTSTNLVNKSEQHTTLCSWREDRWPDSQSGTNDPLKQSLIFPHALVSYAWTGSINLKLQPPKAHITVTANCGAGPVISREYALICITVARTLTFSHAVSVSTFVMFHLHDTYPSLSLLNCNDNAHLLPF